MNTENYGAQDITYLKDLEPVRKRPGMYIGAEEGAIKQMLYEVIDNAVDEFLAGHNKQMDIEIDTTNSKFTVRDFGRGIPIEMHAEGISTIELVLTRLHAGGKFGQAGYKFSGGLHGVGVSAVNALSQIFHAEVNRPEGKFEIEFSEGKVIKPLSRIGACEGRGTKIVFVPDYTIIKDAVMPEEQMIVQRLSEIAMLNPTLTINLKYDDNNYTFYEQKFSNALSRYMNDGITQDIYIEGVDNRFELNLIFNWSKTEGRSMCFTNGIPQAEGGDHLRGALMAICDIVLNYVQEMQTRQNRKTPVVKAEDIKQYLCILLSLKMIEPRFTSQTKEKLSSSEARNYVKQCVSEHFREYMEKNPQICNIIVQHAIQVAAIREEESKDKVKVKISTALPSQLAVCTSKNPEECELFIVEGDSAGGSARIGRERRTQAVLPINGKLLNVMRASSQKIYNSDSVKALISSIGLEPTKPFNVSKLKHHKIIILTDADTDGLHILTLLLIFLVQIQVELILQGFVYVACPPLYKVTIHKTVQYARDNDALYTLLYSNFVKNHRLFYKNKVMKDYEVREIFDILHHFYMECKRMNHHIDSTIVMQLCFHSASDLENILDAVITVKNETESQMTVVCNSIYGTNNYVITKVVKPPILLENITYNNTIFKSIYELYMFILNNRNKSVIIQRFKGLGEMNPEELELTCLEPKNRRLLNVNVNENNAENIIEKCKFIMGDSQERVKFIRHSLGINLQPAEEIYSELDSSVKVNND